MGTANWGSDGRPTEGSLWWTRDKDIIVPKIGLALASIPLIVVLIYDIMLSPEPLRVMGDVKGWVGLGCSSIAIIWMGYWLHSYLKKGIRRSFQHWYTKVDQEGVGDALIAGLPLSAKPVERTKDKDKTSSGDVYYREHIRLQDIDGVRLSIGLIINKKRDLVNVEVMTSDVETRATNDVIEAVSRVMEGLRREEPLVDVLEERRKLETTKHTGARNEQWKDSSSGLTDVFLNLLLVLTVVFAYSFAVWELLYPSQEGMHFGLFFGLIFGQMISLLILIIFFMFDDDSPGKRLAQFEKDYPVRTDFVVWSIEDRLRRLGRLYSLSRRSFSGGADDSDVFELQTKSGYKAFIWVQEEMDSKDKRKTVVHLKTRKGEKAVRVLKRLVDTAVNEYGQGT
jgi:hypothetical protein